MRLRCLTPLLLLSAWSLPSIAQERPEPAPAELSEAAGDERVDPDESGTPAVPLDEIRRYVAVYNAVKQAYVEPVEDADLMQSAIRGLLLDLDPHSVYLDKADAEDFDDNARGAYEGVGVELQRLPDGTLQVIAPIDDTPAARAGLRAGDRIVAIDGEALQADESDSSAPLRGAAGTQVRLTIEREGRDTPLEVTITRETIRITSVRSRMLEPGYGYVRVAAFQADTASDFATQVDALKSQAGGQLRGLVIDVRSNPGGLLTSAVQIADELLEDGEIVATRGRLAISDASFSATAGDRLGGAPVVVLVDAGSASAAEVLAGALRDNDRARVVGSRTFGKGSVQTVLPLDNGDSVKLTTARYYTPSGRSIQAQGIVPDVVLKAENGEGAPVRPPSARPACRATFKATTRRWPARTPARCWTARATSTRHWPSSSVPRPLPRRRRADGPGQTRVDGCGAVVRGPGVAATDESNRQRGLAGNGNGVTTFSPVAASRIAEVPLRSTSSIRTMLCIGRCSTRVWPNSSRRRSSVGSTTTPSCTSNTRSATSVKPHSAPDETRRAYSSYTLPALRKVTL